MKQRTHTSFMTRGAVMGLVLLGVLAVAPLFAQDEGMMMNLRNDEGYKRLQTMRVFLIIDALKLDAKTPKGIAVLDLINKQADDHRQFLIGRYNVQKELFNEMKQQPLNEKRIDDLVAELESLERHHHESQLAYQEGLIKQLSPLERAQLMIADEQFRRRLRDAMEQREKGPGGPRYQRNRPKD